jgi:hypothetical protein
MDEDKWLELLEDSKIMQLYRLGSTLSRDMIPDQIPFEEISKRAISLLKLREVCGSDDGWEIQNESRGGVRTLYKNHPDTPNIHSIRLDGDVDAPMLTILALFHEVDLFNKWLPTYSFLGLKFAKCVAHPSPTELMIHLNINIPWPFSNRYCFFKCDGIDCIDEENPQIGVIMTVR